MHTNRELEGRLGSRVVDRRTLHEWPLSCVQFVSLADGQKRVYKASSGPTVEAQFYAQARSNLLIQGEVVFQDERYTCMLFEYLDAPRLCDRALGEQEALAIGQALQDEIARVEGSYPVYMDISSWVHWQQRMAKMLEGLSSLVSGSIFRVVTPATIADIERAALSKTLKAVIDGPSGLVHNDLTDDNIFIAHDGYRVIDWQRPILGPVGLDLAMLGESLGFDPVRWAGRELTVIMKILLIYWFTECAERWFPEGAETYDQQIAEISSRIF